MEGEGAGVEARREKRGVGRMEGEGRGSEVNRWVLGGGRKGVGVVGKEG